MLRSGEAVVVVAFDLRVADSVGGFDDVFDFVGDFVDATVARGDDFKRSHFGGVKAVERLPKRFAKEEDGHDGHLFFLH